MTPDAILEQWDEAALRFEFPMLDNGYAYPADVRMTIYRDETRWLMILETLSTGNSRTRGMDSFSNFLHLFGNALHRTSGTANSDILYPICSLPDDPLFSNEHDWHVRPAVQDIGIRGQRVPVDLTENHLRQRGLSLLNPPRIDPVVFLRSLLPEYRDALLASSEELAARNIHALPEWLRLDEWHHPNIANDEFPSTSETFQMLAEAIASGDRSRYAPTNPPNTAWQNWPEGGCL